MQGIYRIRNKINNKRYVGSAQDFDERWDIHRRELWAGVHYNAHLQNAWNKYGEENFAFEIEEEVKGSRNDAFTREQEYLDEWFPTGLLYNISPIAIGGRGTGWHHTKEWKQEQSERMSGKNNGMYGKTHSKETKAKQSRVKRGTNNSMYGVRGKVHPLYGKSLTEGHKAKVSIALSGENNPMFGKTGKDNPNYGRHHTEEAKDKLRIINLGENNPRGFLGKHHTKESKTKFSGVNHPGYGKVGYWSGKHHSEETKAKLRGNENNARSYPAFYNVETDEYIPAGKNLTKLCRDQALNFWALQNLKCHNHQQSKDGWRLA